MSATMIGDGLQMLVGLFGRQGPAFGGQAAISDAGNLFFFYEIKEFVNDRIDSFSTGLLNRTMSRVGAVALSLITIWIFFKGLRIMSGKSQDSMMDLVMSSARVAIIFAVATGVAAGGTPMVKAMTDGMTKEIYAAVTGRKNEDPYRAIDESLGYMQLAMLSIDALDANGDEAIDAAKTRAQMFTGVGIAGPSLVGGSLLLLNRIAMALFVGLGPLFIMCLLFDQTKHLFSKWLLFGIGTMFSLAVLSVMVSLALDIVGAVAEMFWVGKFLGTNTEGISSMALQQGGLGMIMTLLMVTVPPMAASFFQGTLGQLSTVNVFGGGGASAAQSQQQTTQQSTNANSNIQQQAQPRNPESQSAGGNNAPVNSLNNPATNPRYGNSAHSPDLIKSAYGGDQNTPQSSGSAGSSASVPSKLGLASRDPVSRQDPDNKGSG